MRAEEIRETYARGGFGGRQPSQWRSRWHLRRVGWGLGVPTVLITLLTGCGDDDTGRLEDAGGGGAGAVAGGGGVGGVDGSSGGAGGPEDAGLLDAGAPPDASMDGGMRFDGGPDADAGVGPSPDGGNDAGCLEPGGTVTLDYDFEAGKHGWTAGFTDLPENPDEELYGLDSGIRTLPEGLPQRQAFFVASHNRSDDIWMFLSRRLTGCQGIVPGRAYAVDFTLDFASNAGEGCVGIGGAPGESVYLKVGASPKPAEVTIEDGYRAFSLDKGNQSQAGPESTSAGHIASPENSCTDASQFALLHREVSHRFDVTATQDGELTVFVGTDSGFEGRTPLYYDRIELTLTPVP